MISFEHQGWTVQIFASTAPACPLIVLPTFAEAVAPVREALADAPDFTLVTLSGFDWEGDLSPWPAPALGKNSAPFAGHADAALALLSEELLPQIEAALPAPPSWRGIAGYSLAGLFAVYALYRCDLFQRAASMSGSLWYPDFLDFAQSHSMRTKPERIYLSVGDKERKTRHPLMRNVQAAAEDFAAHCQALGISTTFQLERGNHFNDAAGRTARGIRWLLEA